MAEKTYLAIDLKSFYASVECVERGLNPLTANLVVADASRTEKTICLAVSPALKSFGIPGRARLFEVVQKVREINAVRLRKAPGGKFSGKSFLLPELEADPSLELDYLVAPPQMAHYMNFSTGIYDLYLRHVAPEDIHVYSIDEVFIDATGYLHQSGLTGRQFAMLLIREVLDATGITATAGVGTNLYLAKIAMDIVAKKIPPDRDGVRIAELDERTYREQLWEHRPLTDFWRVGRGISAKLESHLLYTMGDVARCSLEDEALLYRLFGVNAELLIDHAWGWEPCTMEAIKSYRPQSNSLSSGQVLSCPYSWEKGKMIVREMTELLVLDLVDKGLVTDQMELTVGYDVENLSEGNSHRAYTGAVTTDFYGRKVPKPAHGSINLGKYSSSTKQIMEAVMALYDKVVQKGLLVRRMSVTAAHILRETDVQGTQFEQLDFFTDADVLEKRRLAEEKEKKMQKAMLAIQKKFGKNAILKGVSLEEGATTIERNGQIGGHKA